MNYLGEMIFNISMLADNKLFIAISSIASIVGLMIVIFQINILDNKTKIINKTILETKAKIFFFDIASCIPKTITVITQIQENIRHSQFENTLFKFDGLYSDLIEIKNYLLMSDSKTELDRLINLIIKVQKIKSAIDRSIMDSTTENLKKPDINENLDCVKAVLTEINTKIKKSGGEHSEL